MNEFFRKPFLITVLVFVFAFFVYVLSRYAALAFTPVTKIAGKTPVAERGSIVDRAGKPLAVQTNFYHVGVTPRLVKDADAFSKDIAEPLDMTAEEIAGMIRRAGNASFVYIKKKIDRTAYEELKKITDQKQYTFVRYDRIPGRVYPENSLASQLVGYMGDDGKGLAGAEYSMQDLLQPVLTPGAPKTEQGKNIYLTIDANLQYKLEQISREAMESTQAESMMLIAADSRTGEILSYISLPSANLNEYGRASAAETTDRPAMTAYEPGSVFKIFTVSILYDSGLISGGSSFLCDGLYERRAKGGETIRIKCLEHHGYLTPREALKYSCNDAIAQMSDLISEDEFIARIKALGFGRRTGVELPGETAGSVKTQESPLWSARSKPTIAIGQEISVSALQMVHAASAIANGGVPLRLTILKKVTNKDGSPHYEHQAQPEDRVFKKETADYLLSCMETTATTGTGSRARLNDIAIGVKTGTAQMADTERGGYSDTDFLSNCIAIFPVEDPQIILYIVIEKAKGETLAGRIVAPVIAKAADEIIDHLGLSRGDAASLEHSGRIRIEDSAPLTLGSTLPDFTGMSKRNLLPLLERTDIHVIINGSGWVKTQNPPAGSAVTENMTIELNLE